MMTDRQTVICRKENPRVVGQSALVELIEDTTDLRIEMSDNRIVFPALRLHRVLGARERRELFIAKIRAAAYRIFKGILRLKIDRQLNPLQRILVEVFLRRLPRVVRRIESHVHEERVFALLSLLEVIDGVVGRDLAPVLPAVPKTAQ